MELKTYITRVLNTIHPKYTTTVDFEVHLDAAGFVVDSSLNIVRFTVNLKQEGFDAETMMKKLGI